MSTKIVHIPAQYNGLDMSHSFVTYDNGTAIPHLVMNIGEQGREHLTLLPGLDGTILAVIAYAGEGKYPTFDVLTHAYV
jgi:hypothetical protein